ncbi:hypothetical protein HMPREF9965_0731 [Streptococcus mitis bv. 2 str. SK95]|uniref:LXG domain-containing protein n=1 Tax=Streptococcus mitis bv. 2 str. SK95 TaxID=1000588 RepID=F9LY42_STROR|nr:hypothetical protein [Streptococcus mitis]EGU65008.1 hypothetical protein HMPREF9965_0731 [Streptococcus mitis bv. 2 str. SK95]
MVDGVFTIPMSEYYSKSSELKDKVSDLITDVENNFLSKVSTNISTLDNRDISVVEGFASYTSAKSKLETLKEYETQLTKMSTEGDSNPLNGVVSLDKQYSAKFSDVSKGADSQTVASAISGIDRNISSQVEVIKIRESFVAFISSLTGIGEKEAIAKLLGIDVNDLGKWSKAAADRIKGVEDALKLLETLYTGSGKGISFETLLYSKEIGQALQSSPLVEKVLTFMMDLPYALKSSKWASKFSKVLAPFTKGLKHVKTAASFLMGEHATGIGNVAKDFIKSDKLKIGGETLAWGVLAVEEGVNIYKNYNNSKTDSKTAVGKIGKSAIGGTIDTISNVGPLDGMWLGAKAGGLGGNPVGGALVGLAVGTFNLAGSIFFPEEKKALYDGAKNLAYGAVDMIESGVESIGKGLHQGFETVKSVGKNVSDFFNGGLKAASSLFG